MRRFELVDGKSSKFWEVSREGVAVTVRFGKIGTNGQTQNKTYPTAEKAQTEHDKLVKEKVGKGYAEITQGAKKAAPAETAASVEADSPKPKAKKNVAAAEVAPPMRAEDGWVDAGDGYKLALRDGKLVCQNAKGQKLGSVPKDVKESEAGAQLIDLRDWIVVHDKECQATVESWMLRSLSVPCDLLRALWPDAGWRAALENAVVVPVDASGARDASQTGFLRASDPQKGIGVVTLDGETAWIKADAIAIPHPILLSELADLRALSTELSLTQGLPQLLRETYTRPRDLPATAVSVKDFVGGDFAQLNHALGLCRRLGYRVSGGWALTRVWEGGEAFEARLWIGSDDPICSTCTDELVWVDEEERTLKVAAVGPVAFSEGMRLGSQIFAGRVVPKEDPNA